MMRRVFLNLPALFFAFALSLSACGGKAGKNAKDEATLAEARKIHNEAFQIHKEVMKDLEALKKKATLWEDSLRAYLRTADVPAEGVKNLFLSKEISAIREQEKAMSEWMKNVQEVAGEESHEGHNHSHEGHDHNHDHKPAPDVSAADMLAYQKEMKKNIEKLREDVKALLKK